MRGFVQMPDGAALVFSREEGNWMTEIRMHDGTALELPDDLGLLASFEATLSQAIEAAIGKFTPDPGAPKMVTVVVPAGKISGAAAISKPVTMKLMDAYNVRTQLLQAIDVLGPKTDMGHPPAPGKKK
jgi:hypothetical protein